MKKVTKLTVKGIKVGLTVVMSDVEDAYFYTIDEVNGLNVKLSTVNARWNIPIKSSVGWWDYSLCQLPSKEQLEWNREYEKELELDEKRKLK